MLKFSEKILHRAESALMLALAVTLCVCTWAQGRAQSISASVIRLHVLAESDAPYEQALKMRVRDAVLRYLEAELSPAESPEDAEDKIFSALGGIADAAVSAAEGRKISVAFGEERYPTRVYEGFTLPAGRYRSLRISIGEGKGHNWWCIVYPQACLPAAQGGVMREAMSAGDYRIVTESGFQPRLKLLELWEELVASFD